MVSLPNTAFTNLLTHSCVAPVLGSSTIRTRTGGRRWRLEAPRFSAMDAEKPGAFDVGLMKLVHRVRGEVTKETERLRDESFGREVAVSDRS